MSRSLSAQPAYRVELLVLTCICAAIGLLKLPNTFVWDDVGLLVQSDMLYDLRNVPVVFTHNAMFPSDGGAYARVAQLDTYRPFTLLTFMLDGALWGKRPLGFHITNFALHVGTVAVLYRLLLARVGEPRRRIACWLAALFALHPLLTEAHVWINGRSDTLATLLVLLSVLAFRRARDIGRTARSRAGLLLSCGVTFFGAALSKEVAITVLPALSIWAACEAPDESRARPRGIDALLGLWPFAIAISLYLAARVAVLSGLKTHGGSEHARLALPRIGLLLWDGLGRALVPTQTSLRYLREEYERLPASLLAAGWLLTLAAAFFAIRHAKRDPGPLWGITWYAAALSPASLISGLQWYGFGRYLYLPLTGLLLGCAPALARCAARGLSHPRLRRVLVGAAAAQLLLFALLSSTATLQWRDGLQLYLAIVHQQPNRSHGHAGLGRWLIEHGHARQAIPELERALRLAPDDSRHYTNLGNAYLLDGRADAASSTARAGTARFPDHISLWRLRARTAASVGDARDAMSAALEALRLDPEAGENRALLGSLLASGPQQAQHTRALDELLADPRYAALSSRIRQRLEPAVRRP